MSDIIAGTLIAQIALEAAFGIIILIIPMDRGMKCHVLPRRARDKRLHGKPCAVVQYPTGQRGRPDLRPEDDRWRTGGASGHGIALSCRTIISHDNYQRDYQIQLVHHYYLIHHIITLIIM